MLAEHVGVREHPWQERDAPSDVACAQWDFVAPDDPRLDIAARAWELDEEARGRFSEPLTLVTDGRLKLLRRGEADELYDLDADPLELEPRAIDGNPAAAALEEALGDPRLWATGESEAVEVSAEELAELESRMKLLGYM